MVSISDSKSLDKGSNPLQPGLSYNKPPRGDSWITFLIKNG